MACQPYLTTVRPGDGWYRIASRFGIKAAALAEANHSTFERVLHPGDELIVPGRCATAPDAPQPAAPPFLWVTSTEDDTLEAWYRPGRPLIFLIIHDPVAPSPEGLMRYLHQNERKVSYNDVLVPGHAGAPPKVHVLSDRDEWVGHAGSGTAIDYRTGSIYGKAAGGNLNWVSWGICLFKTPEDNGPFPAAMYRGGVELAAYRAKQFGIDPRNILSHQEVDPTRRSDPRGINMARFRADVINALQF